MKKKHLKMINKAIESINWDDVAYMYKATDWRWSGLNNIPDASELELQARKLAIRAIVEKQRLISTGGITIIWNKKTEYMGIFVGYSGSNWD